MNVLKVLKLKLCYDW